MRLSQALQLPYNLSFFSSNLGTYVRLHLIKLRNPPSIEQDDMQIKVLAQKELVSFFVNYRHDSRKSRTWTHFGTVTVICSLLSAFLLIIVE